jgi:hypothetical protein
VVYPALLPAQPLYEVLFLLFFELLQSFSEGVLGAAFDDSAVNIVKIANVFLVFTVSMIGYFSCCRTRYNLGRLRSVLIQ